ncbi:NAD(P)-dependent oxidoreductase [Ideonella livida]|uniref:NAD(P)-dependent oxidoreductase n=1 Tax=Ideonella livida TaxID=2707176 RepID=A0A7C9TLL2_9BURK|nr:NAD(P)-dependent oxidoreductase [Ideonella livida]NDY93599.1 NAD(P)-dependent oxidoreductase [Ideonella livida]
MQGSKVAIIGLGEVGLCLAQALQAGGHALALCAPRPGAAAQALAHASGSALQATPGPWLAAVDWVLCCVPGAQALAVATQAAPHLAPGAVWADLSTAPPEVKRQAAQALAAGPGAAAYVDVAIMGAVSLGGVRTPLLAAGPQAAALAALLQAAGGRVQCLEGGQPGQAMALKLLRSGLTKGLEALAVELLTSAERQGLREQLYTQLADIDETPLRDFLDMLVRTHVVHARRRLQEVDDTAQALAAQGAPSQVLPGVARRFAQTVAALHTHPLPVAAPSATQALAWLLATQPALAAQASGSAAPAASPASAAPMAD